MTPSRRHGAPLAAMALAALAASVALAGCVPAPAAAPPGAAAPGYVQILRASEVDLWRAANRDAVTLDVRDPAEWSGAPVPLLIEAVQIPLPELETRLGEVEPFRSRTVLVLCQTGLRAQSAAQLLSRKGFRDVAWVDGGIDAYRRWLESR